MVDAFSKLGFRPPLTPGHVKDAAGIPAIGYVDKLYRNGKKLLADFVDLPASVFTAIKQRLFDTVSAEIYWDLDRNGSNFPRALKAVALLGAEVPAVDLKPLHETVFKFAAKKEYSFGLLNYITKEIIMEPEEIKKLQDDNAALAAKVTELSQKTADKTQMDALQKQLTESNDAIKKLSESNQKLHEASKKAEAEKKSATIKLPALRPYFQALYEAADTAPKFVKFSLDGNDTDHTAVQLLDALAIKFNALTDKYFTPATIATEDTKQYINVAEEIDTLVKAHMAKNSVKEYKVAMQAIFTERPDLKQAYAQTTQ